MLVGSMCIAFAARTNQKKNIGLIREMKTPSEGRSAIDTVPQTYFITAPEGWTQKDELVAGVKHTQINSPDDGPGDDFTENINVNAEAAKGYDSKTYAEANLGEIRKGVPGVEITDLGESMIGDLHAECYIYSFTYSGRDLKDLAWYVAKNDVGYVITCTALKSTFDRFESKFKTCASSFEIK